MEDEGGYGYFSMGTPLVYLEWQPLTDLTKVHIIWYNKYHRTLRRFSFRGCEHTSMHLCGVRGGKAHNF